MQMPLTNAAFDKPLTVAAITNGKLEAMLAHLGLFPGRVVFRQNEEILRHPVRVRSRRNEVVLGGGMAMRVIVHLDDGRRMPLSDMEPGQTGHIEGTTCSGMLSESLEVLGLCDDESITCIRKLPHMDYTIRVDPDRRERITEGLAAKIWGRAADRSVQFISAGKDQEFVVEKILGGSRSFNALGEKGISPGKTIVLESVAPAQTLAMTHHEPVVITTDDGLHLHLKPGQAKRILVEPN